MAGAGPGRVSRNGVTEIRSEETDTGLVTASYNTQHRHPSNWLPVIFADKRPNLKLTVFKRLCLHRLSVKGLAGIFNQDKALIGRPNSYCEYC